MSEITSFLSAELTEIGLMAAVDPHFAERLLEALRRLPAERAGEPAAVRETTREHPEDLCA